jgi:hypothetical protein
MHCNFYPFLKQFLRGGVEAGFLYVAQTGLQLVSFPQYWNYHTAINFWYVEFEI